MTRHDIPDSEELARRIRTAFDALPGPDAERLAVVRSRLERQLTVRHKQPRRQYRRRSWYWLWLLLAGSAVAAAWWSGSVMLNNDGRSMDSSEPPAVGTKSRLPQDSPAGAESEGDVHDAEAAEDATARIIYRREQ